MDTFGARPLNRPDPLLPVTKMVTHAILQPLQTHWRKATCAEVDCEHYLNGWGVAKRYVDDRLLASIKQAGYRFSTVEIEDGQEHLWFEAGQLCFKAGEHRKLTDREPLFVARSGDWRGNPDGANAKPLMFSGADAWKDSLGTTLDRCQG